MTKNKIEAPWLQSNRVKKVVAALGSDNVRFVGGAVRDTLVGIDVIDIDAATTHKPNENIRLLEDSGIKAIPTGLDHGTVTAVVDGEPVEITTLRVDIETDGRHADVAFTTDWLEDAKRRDFTFNAMYLDADGTLYDPFDGESDLKKGKVAFIGDAKERIKEDGLRILRLFRFQALFGKQPISENALDACQQLAPMLADLSVERIRTELSKLLKANDPVPSLEAMVEVGLFEALDVKIVDLKAFVTLIESEKSLGSEIDPLLRLFVLLHKDRSAEDIATWLKLSNKNKQFLCAVEACISGGVPSDDKERRVYLYKHGCEVSQALAVVNGQQALFDMSDDFEIPSLPVQGRDLMAAGLLPGPEIGATLKRLEDLWVDSDFTLNKNELLAQL